jgi:hypothetical protein
VEEGNNERGEIDEILRVGIRRLLVFAEAIGVDDAFSFVIADVAGFGEEARQVWLLNGGTTKRAKLTKV